LYSPRREKHSHLPGTYCLFTCTFGFLLMVL
jgi:hypothetical protein